MSEKPGEQAPDPASQFFQRPVFNAFERLVCSHLIEAGKTDQPLQTVIHVALAALSLDDDTRAKLGIDRGEAKALYTVAQRLLSATEELDNGFKTFNLQLKSLPWGTCLKPWVAPGAYGYSFSDEEAEYFRKLREGGDNTEYFLQSSKQLTPAGYAHMVSDFLSYAIPIVQAVSRRLSVLISPETFVELLRIYHGERPPP